MFIRSLTVRWIIQIITVPFTHLTKNHAVIYSICGVLGTASQGFVIYNNEVLTHEKVHLCDKFYWWYSLDKVKSCRTLQDRRLNRQILKNWKLLQLLFYKRPWLRVKCVCSMKHNIFYNNCEDRLDVVMKHKVVFSCLVLWQYRFILSWGCKYVYFSQALALFKEITKIMRYDSFYWYAPNKQDSRQESYIRLLVVLTTDNKGIWIN